MNKNTKTKPSRNTERLSNIARLTETKRRLRDFSQVVCKQARGLGPMTYKGYFMCANESEWMMGQRVWPQIQKIVGTLDEPENLNCSLTSAAKIKKKLEQVSKLFKKLGEKIILSDRNNVSYIYGNCSVEHILDTYRLLYSELNDLLLDMPRPNNSSPQNDFLGKLAFAAARGLAQ